MAIVGVSYVVEWKPDSSWVDISSSLVDPGVSGMGELSGNQDNPLAFGDDSTRTCDIPIRYTLGVTGIDGRPIRVTYTAVIGATTYTRVVFQGIVTGVDGDLDSATLHCSGVAELVKRQTKDLYSPAFWRRPVATATTASNQEDPDEVGYTAGLINWLLWRSGGRPLEQDFSYPDADFYYSCDYAILAPDWGWVAGENGWEEALRLARASGGQIYQGRDGVVYYRQPLGFAAGAAAVTFGADLTQATNTLCVYGGAAFRANSEQRCTKIVGTYTPRSARVMQEVIDDTTIRQVGVGSTETIYLEPKWPLKSLELSGGQLPAGAIVATYLDGSGAAAGYTHTVSVAAQRVTLAVTNTSTHPIMIWRITLKGEPIVAGEAQTVSVGSGTLVRTMEDNISVQSRAHAERLATMALAFYQDERPIYTLSDCPFHPELKEGDTVGLTVSQWGLTAVPCLIVAIRHDDTGTTASYDLVPVTGLPANDDYYQVGSTNYAGQTKKVTW